MEFIVYSRNYSKSDTLSEHSLRRIMKEKLIVKQRGKYHVNFRSSTVILKILFLMREFSSDPCFEEGFDRLMDILAERTSIGTKGAIRFSKLAEDWFWDYTVELVPVPRNLRNFFTV